jgi:hypothetical protein
MIPGDIQSTIPALKTTLSIPHTYLLTVNTNLIGSTMNVVALLRMKRPRLLNVTPSITRNCL